MGMFLFPAERSQKSQAAHKIGAAILGPRIAGAKFYGREAFSD